LLGEEEISLDERFTEVLTDEVPIVHSVYTIERSHTIFGGKFRVSAADDLLPKLLV
jgi:hypothetical protein